VCSLLASGCFYFGKNQAEDVLQRPVAQWSSRDCLTVLLSSMRNNLFDQQSPNIKVIATPYTPTVIAAINRMRQTKEHWSDAEAEHQIDTSLALQAGLYFDWKTNLLVDSRGYYVRSSSQLDRFQFLLTLRNNSWPCAIPVVIAGGRMAPLTKVLSDWPCYIPGITDLDQRIFLENDRGVILKPEHVWGRKHDVLTIEETLIVLFDFKQGSVHLFEGTKNAYLVITGFDAPIRLAFPLPVINPSLKQIAVE